MKRGIISTRDAIIARKLFDEGVTVADIGRRLQRSNSQVEKCLCIDHSAEFNLSRKCRIHLLDSELGLTLCGRSPKKASWSLEEQNVTCQHCLEKLNSGRPVRDCKQCGKTFSPSHGLVKYCNVCRLGSPDAYGPYRYRTSSGRVKVPEVTGLVCAVDGCERPTKIRGYCGPHYGRILRTGTPGECPIGDRPVSHICPHKNGDRLDNQIGNLELWSRYRQPPGQRVEDKVAWAIGYLLEHPELVKTAGFELVPLPERDEIRRAA